jgi:hypothetical protein
MWLFFFDEVIYISLICSPLGYYNETIFEGMILSSTRNISLWKGRSYSAPWSKQMSIFFFLFD